MEFDYNLELEKAIEKIKQEQAKKVLLQLPDGLKPKAKEIKQTIEKETNAEVSIWLGSCFGACDFPKDIEKDVDLLIAWGHASWKY
jgi:2-(3-amino-3-carboxypropyl)histidine synthase